MFLINEEEYLGKIRVSNHGATGRFLPKTKLSSLFCHILYVMF